MRTRAEHLAWCKERAYQEYDYYVEHEPSEAIRNAVASMLSDLGKHDGTAKMLEIAFAISCTARDKESLFKFIDGFN